MSLINQMLKDLETREDRGAHDRRPEQVYQDLSPVPTPAARAKRPWLLGALAMSIAAGAGLYLWQLGRDGMNSTAALPDAASPVSGPMNSASVPVPAAPSAAEQKPASLTSSIDRTEVAVASVAPTADAPSRATPSTPAVSSPRRKGSAAVSVKPKRSPSPPAARTPVKRRAPAPRKRSAAIAATDTTVVDKKVLPLTPGQLAETKYREALGFVQQGRLADAAVRLKAALAADAAHIKARDLFVGTMLQQGRWREAQELLQQGIKAVPRHPPFVQLLARIQVERGQEAQALALMEQGAPSAQQDPAYLSFLATLYQRAGRHGDAAKVYTQAVGLRPQEGRWWLGLAISLEAKEDYAAAINSYQRAIGSGVLNGKPLQYARQRLSALQDN